jgi:hypothetical protein
MAEVEVQFAGRYMRRQFEKGVGRSIAKILTELVTNSDDSYKRLIAAGRRSASKILPITIRLARSRRRFIVIDNAEGLTEENMERAFGTYGRDSGDRDAGLRTRSLFGKGLRDVLFTQDGGTVFSIKSGRSAVCKFRWKTKAGDEVAVVDINAGPRVTDALRRKWEIPSNGTRVEFQLRDDINLPQHDKLVEKLSNFYMLRPINGNPMRRVALESDYVSRGREETTLRYVEPVGKLIDRVDTKIAYEGARVDISGKLYIHDDDMTQAEAGYEDRDGGLLVIDEDGSALDLTLFTKFDADPAAARLFGSIELRGAGRIIRDRLNARRPEEVLTETRDGFDRKHAFYREVAAVIEPWLSPHVEAERDRRKQEQQPLPEELARRHRQAFDKLNELYRKLVGSTPGVVPHGPETKIPEKMAFMWPSVTIKAGQVVRIPLVVNVAKIPDGTTITVGDDSDDIEVEPMSIQVDEKLAKAGVFIRTVAISSDKAGAHGTVTATAPNDARAELKVDVVPADVYRPADGLGFQPDAVQVHPNERRSLWLWADLSKVRMGASIKITTDLPELSTDNDSITLSDKHRVTDDVARVRVKVTGTRLGVDGIVSARADPHTAEVHVEVTRKRDVDPGAAGKFRGYRFEKIERRIPSLIDAEGFVVVNMTDETNRRFFTDDPATALQSSAPAQTRLAELVLDECLQRLVSEAIQSNSLERKFPDNAEIDIRNYVQEQKFELGADIYAAFVRPAGPEMQPIQSVA